MAKTCKVFLVDKTNLKKLSGQNIFKTSGFDADYKKTFLSFEKMELYVGTVLKKIKTFDPYYKIDFYALGGEIARAVSETKIDKLSIEKPLIKNKISKQEIIDLILGIKQGLWKFDKFVKKDSDKKDVEIKLGSGFARIIKEDDWKLINSLNKGLITTRNLVEETPENANPSTLPRMIESELSEYKNVEIKVVGKAELEKVGMNGVLTVGRASIHEPVMTHVIIKPLKKAKNKIILVGKGLTYDSGGLDIKISGSMKSMKMDMGGASTVFGVMKALAGLGLENTEVHWISAFVENMVGGNAYKSDDIITSYSGQTIEVWNTDAEGRITLADVLAYATFEDPDYIVDFATLTGACVFANSPYYTGLMGNDRKLVNSLMKSFEKVGETTMNNPLAEALRETVVGDISDLRNIASSREAGHITAGLFLSYFVDQKSFRNDKLKIKNPKTYSWAHLDIAGSVKNECKNQLGVKGATGQHVRGVVDWVLGIDG